MHRRLPVFFVLDCSESMAGHALRQMQDGIESIVRTLRTDPHALETVHICVIAFAGVARAITPLVELAAFYPPRLPLGSGTSLGAALDTLMTEIDRSVIRSTPDRKGDWKPVVYLFTDGRPTDNPDAALQRWQTRYASRVMMVAVGLGRGAHLSTLKRLTDRAILFDGADTKDFKRFIQWVSASVQVQSTGIHDTTHPDQQHPLKLDEGVLKLIKNISADLAASVDNTCATFVGRCSQHRHPYLIKYDRDHQSVSTRDFQIKVLRYMLAGSHVLDEDYFNWSDPRQPDGLQSVNSSDLIGAPTCPHCNNPTAFAVCYCGKLMCINGLGEATCPWCRKKVSFSLSDDTGFNVNRGRG